MTMVLGLTGGIATGKTTVSHYFKQLGIPIVDSDIIAREVVEPGTTGLQKIRKSFGDEILAEDGSLNRKKLGNLVFGDENLRRQLNQVLHDELDVAISSQISEWVARAVPLVVVDVPLMYEAHYDEKVDQVMVVYVPEAIQLARLMLRDNLTESAARQRMESQMPIEEKRLRGDIVIDNAGSREETEAQLAKWLESLA